VKKVPPHIENTTEKIEPGQQTVRFGYTGEFGEVVVCRPGSGETIAGDEPSCGTDPELTFSFSDEDFEELGIRYIHVDFGTPIHKPGDHVAVIKTADATISVTAFLKAPPPPPPPPSKEDEPPEIDISSQK